MNSPARHIEPQQPYASELVELDSAEQQLAELREKYGTLPDYTAKAGYAEGKQAIQALTKMRTGTDKARLAITKPHRDFIERVNQRAKALIGEVETLEKPHRDAKREVDEAEERKRQERIARLQERLAKEVTSYLDTAVGLDAGGLAELIAAAEAIDTEGYFDITKEAEDEKARVIRELRAQHDQTLLREQLQAERAEIEREKAELARLRAESDAALIPAEDVADASDLVEQHHQAAQAPAEPDHAYGESLADLQAAGLEVSDAVAALTAIQSGSVRHITFTE